MKRWVTMMLALALAARSGAVHAQPSMLYPPAPPVVAESVPPTDKPAAANQLPPNPDEVSPELAFGVSFGGAVASYAVMGAALADGQKDIFWAGVLGGLVLPSAGRWYAHSSNVTGLLIRAGGLGMAVAGASLLHPLCGTWGSSSSSCSDSALPMGLFGFGAAAYLAGTFVDIIGAPRDAERYNRKLREVSIVPMVSADGGGLAIAGRF